jgi:hypothetical protein
VATAGVAGVFVAAGVATVAAEYSPVGAWWDQWRRTIRHLTAIREFYARADGSLEDLKAEVEYFFVACWHVHDYILRDKINLPTLNDANFWAHKNADLNLKIAQTFANTHKHLERRNLNDPISRVKSVSIGPPHNFALISYEEPPKPEQQYDALQLVEGCANSWETFFKAEGIKPPA